MLTFSRLRYRQVLLLCLVLTALGTILLPMQIEQPLFFFKAKQVDNRMFVKSLVNPQQIFNEGETRLSAQRELLIKQLNAISEKPVVNESLPKAWILKVAELTTKESALAQVNELKKQGLPAYYQQQLATYQVVVGPELDLTKIKNWQAKIADKQPETVIKIYQPV